MVFVSHDRYFIDKLATRVFEIADGDVRVFPGNYEDYLWRKSGGNVDLTLDESQPPAFPKPFLVAVTTHEKPKAKAKTNPIRVKQLESQRAALEKTTAGLETEIAEIEGSLANYVNAEETRRLTTLLDQRKADLERAVAEWEQVSLALDELS